MNDSNAPLRQLAAQLFDRLITGLGPPDFKDNPATLELFVERGVVHPLALVASDAPSDQLQRIVEPLIVAAPRAADAIVVDRAGHARPVYRPLLVHAWLHALRVTRPSLGPQASDHWSAALRCWCDVLAVRLSRWQFPTGAMPASHGAATAEMAWTALALHHAATTLDRPDWSATARLTFSEIRRRQSTAGAFLDNRPSDNPETHWYHELLILHAVANFAVDTRDSALRAAVTRAATFHQEQTQPDHATNQPWALVAFAWTPDTRPVADGMLHALAVHAAVERDRGLPPLTLMLLADALYCVRQLLTDPTP